MPTIDLVAEAYELQIDSAATGGISKLHFGIESERFSRLEKERNDFLLKRTPFSYALSTNRTIGDTPFQVMLRAAGRLIGQRHFARTLASLSSIDYVV